MWRNFYGLDVTPAKLIWRSWQLFLTHLAPPVAFYQRLESFEIGVRHYYLQSLANLTQVPLAS
jgi:hypothetical protein